MRLNLSLKYAILIAFSLLIVIGLIVGFIYRKHEQMVMTQIEMQAKALFKQIVITRRWVADHGGVYVEQLPWVQANPYLPNGAITDVSGKRYVKENPAMVTKQLSQYAEKEKLYFFHITSLKLLNPANAPDDFERKALIEFETKNLSEASTTEKIGSSYYYRYISPLFVEQACLECHNHQDYTIGDIRGAISVSIPIDMFVEVTAAERRYILWGMAAVGLLLVGILYFASRRILISPIREIQSHMNAFSRTGNADFPIVRTGDEIEDLSRSFRDMATAIQEYHDCLQEKIRSATRELTEKNEALARSSQSKSEFIARTSHELRTPLTAIKGAMDYLSVKLSMRECDDDRDLLIFFEMIRKNADRLIRLVNNLLDFERIDLGTIEMRFRETDLKDVFREVIVGFEPLAAARSVAIRMKATECRTYIDEDRMKQVLTNLLSNALYFSPESSRIQVTIRCDDGRVYAAVDDMGVRIPAEEREKIFEKYYTRNVGGGTGLGLAICKGIIEAHGGEIGAEDSEWGGSRFWFRFPQKRKEGHYDEREAVACDRRRSRHPERAEGES